MKGIKCFNCESRFRWVDVPKPDRKSPTTCRCPFCKTLLRITFPVKRFSIFVTGSIALLCVALWSLFAWHATAAISLSALGVVGAFAAMRYCFPGGLLSSVPVDETV